MSMTAARVDVMVVEHPYEPYDECFTLAASTAAGERVVASVAGNRSRVGLREFLTLEAIAAVSGLGVLKVTAH
jgi:hypothetical protein